MAFLTAILTHLDDQLVRGQLDYLRELAPDSSFVVCFGGSLAEFNRLTAKDALFIDDPSLHGDPDERSHVKVLTTVYDSRVRDDPEIAMVYFIEFDHLILRGDFERELASIADRTGAGLVAKAASPRNDTNWPHFLRYRDDERVNRFFSSISCREDPDRRWGCLGNGMLFSREALAAFCSIGEYPQAYVEMLVPSLVHHLGFEIADVDMHSDLYAAVSWRPVYGVDEAIQAKCAGRAFVHPFKRPDALHTIRSA